MCVSYYLLDEEAMKLFTTEIDEEEEEKVRLTLKSLLKVSKPNSNEQTDRKSAANRKPRFNVKRGGRFRFQNRNKKVIVYFYLSVDLFIYLYKFLLKY